MPLIEGVTRSGDGKIIAVDTAGNLLVSSIGANEAVLATSVSWADSAGAGTVKTVDIPLPTEAHGQARYLVTITNPSTETALSVQARNKVTLNGTVRYPEVTDISVLSGKPDGKSVLVEGFLLGEGGRITLSNDTALGLTGGFTADVEVRKL